VNPADLLTRHPELAAAMIADAASSTRHRIVDTAGGPVLLVVDATGS
jgi:hypothetical protein